MLILEQTTTAVSLIDSVANTIVAIAPMASQVTKELPRTAEALATGWPMSYGVPEPLAELGVTVFRNSSYGNPLPHGSLAWCRWQDDHRTRKLGGTHRTWIDTATGLQRVHWKPGKTRHADISQCLAKSAGTLIDRKGTAYACIENGGVFLVNDARLLDDSPELATALGVANVAGLSPCKDSTRESEHFPSGTERARWIR